MADGKYLPQSNPIRIRRDKRILELAAKGLTPMEIGKQVDLDRSRVGAIIVQYAKGDLQAYAPAMVDKHKELIQSEDERVALGAVKLGYQANNIITNFSVEKQTNLFMQPGSYAMIASAFGIQIPAQDEAETTVSPDIVDVTPDK